MGHLTQPRRLWRPPEGRAGSPSPAWKVEWTLPSSKMRSRGWGVGVRRGRFPEERATEQSQGWWALSLDLINPLLPLAHPSHNPFRPMLTKQWPLPRSRQMMEGSFALSAARTSGGAGAEGMENGSGGYPRPQRTSFHPKGVHCPCLSRPQKLPTLTWVRPMIPQSRRMSEGTSLGEEVLADGHTRGKSCKCLPKQPA